MLAVLSPAKTLDFCAPASSSVRSQPAFLDESERLVERLRRLSGGDLAKLMSISPKLADLNRDRFRAWCRPFTRDNAKPALLAFRGDVYRGFDLDRYTEEDFRHAQSRLRILSGLYGVLKPMDLIQPYRLEMGTRLKNQRGKDLYEFWGNRITDAINRALRNQGDGLLVNLASNEYYLAIQPGRVKGRVVTPVFKDWKNGRLRIISFFAKKARGMMCDFLIRNRLTGPDDLCAFDREGYGYDAALSTADELVFTRAER